MNGRFSASYPVAGISVHSLPASRTPPPPPSSLEQRTPGGSRADRWKIHGDAAASDSRPLGRVSVRLSHLGPGTYTGGKPEFVQAGWWSGMDKRRARGVGGRAGAGAAFAQLRSYTQAYERQGCPRTAKGLAVPARRRRRRFG